MSSYNNRIPKDSVAFSTKPFIFDIDLNDLGGMSSKDEDPSIREIRKKENFLLSKEQELIQKEEELDEFQKKLHQEHEIFEQDRERVSKELHRLEENIEKQKRRDYYQMREFMWEKSIEMAEEMVNQCIELNNLSFMKLFDGLIKKLPIAFDELEITVHPLTLEMINSEENKDTWILQNIKWKFDYSLQVGDFIIEEENEYYDNRLSSLFSEIKKRVHNNLENSRGDGDHDIVG